MTIFILGAANPAAFDLPGLYINVQAPPSAPLPGAPTDILGIVGVASWGPVDSAVGFSDEAEAAVLFGAMKVRDHDITTHVHIAQMQGVRNFRAVRVTDGTDTAASALIGGATGLTLTSRYTGTKGAETRVVIADGTKADTKRVTITFPGLPPETFDNIPATAASNASWLAIRDAINNGISGQSASRLVVASVGALATAPANGAFALAGGSDGSTGVTSADLLGAEAADGGGRTGLYALRETGIAAFLLADVSDFDTFAAQAAFAVSEATFGYGVSPSGDTVAEFKEAMDGAGIDTPWFKVIFGDWAFMIDGVNNVTRMVSPQAFEAGTKVVIGPHQTTLNKPIQGLVGTEKSEAQQTYSQAELRMIGAARGDVIIMKSPGGDYPSMAFGRNSSSDRARRLDAYTTMTNYLARTFDQRAGVGRQIGRLITPEQMREAQSTLGGFLQNEWDDGRIGNAQGTLPYSVQVDALNNPANRVALGAEKASVKVQYLSIVETFQIDLTGGQTVQIAAAQPLAA